LIGSPFSLLITAAYEDRGPVLLADTGPIVHIFCYKGRYNKMIKRVSKYRKCGFAGLAQAALFGLAVLLSTGCASTGGGVRAGLIAPVTAAHEGSVQEGMGLYEPPENPDLNSLTGPD
jgi:hypothetical protein